jgi:hypothetical protein
MSSLRLLSALVLALLVSAPALAQQRDATLPRLSPNATASFTVGVTDVSVIYGAPSVRGRDIFGALVPHSEIWRAGANEATGVSFAHDVTVNGQPLSAGTYGLFVMPTATTWTFVFNRVAGQWGAYQYDASADVLRLEAPRQAAPFRETMAFTFDNAARGEGTDGVDPVLHWAESRASVRIETDTDAQVMALATRAVAGDDYRQPLAYARWALQSGRHLHHGREWAEAAARMDERYETLSVLARLQAAGGDHAAAAATGERAIEQAAGLAEQPRDLEPFRRDVATWREGG